MAVTKKVLKAKFDCTSIVTKVDIGILLHSEENLARLFWFSGQCFFVFWALERLNKVSLEKGQIQKIEAKSK